MILPCDILIVRHFDLRLHFRKVTQLNNLLFDGYPVMVVRDTNILFETDLIRIQEAVYVDRTNTGEFYGRALSSGATSPLQYPVATAENVNAETYVAMPSAVPVTSGRTLIVRVPPNAGPGSVLSVTAPDGTLLSVRVASLFINMAISRCINDYVYRLLFRPMSLQIARSQLRTKRLI